MRFERRPFPSRTSVIARVLGSIVAAVFAAIYPGTWFLYSGYLVWPDISILVRECGLAIALAAIDAQVTSNYDRRRANIITAALAYLSAQAIWRGFAVNIHPGDRGA